MKIIEIKTTQNVVLQYELAELRDRILAFLIDFSFIIGGLIGLQTVTSIIMGYGPNAQVVQVLNFCLFMFYTLAFESLNKGQTPGKMLMKIQVIKTTTGRPQFTDYTARWIFRLVDIYFTFGAIASIMIASSSRAQRIGDIVANTAVIKLTPQMNLELEDILMMHSQAGYKPEFVQARQLDEADAILIKNALDRHRRFQNDAHTQAMELLASEVAKILNIDNRPPDNQKFLEIILRDYVMLTR
jgi:uncharacterized RDD family membrane protein YckC